MSIGDTFKSITKGMPSLVTGGQPGYRAGDAKLAWNKSDLAGSSVINVSSTAFEDGQPIPATYSGDGKNIPPPLFWTGSTDKVQSFALVVEDPDAPTPDPYVHWLLYNIPASVRQLPEGLEKEPGLATFHNAMQGKNSSLKTGWTGMAPPKGDTPHRYFFQLFALDTRLNLDSGIGRAELFDAMSGHVIARGRTIGTYQR
jgi:Raf kinase inhibitor-like YbhB/YbcL family protein